MTIGYPLDESGIDSMVVKGKSTETYLSNYFNVQTGDAEVISGSQVTNGKFIIGVSGHENRTVDDTGSIQELYVPVGS